MLTIKVVFNNVQLGDLKQWSLNKHGVVNIHPAAIICPSEIEVLHVLLRIQLKQKINIL